MHEKHPALRSAIVVIAVVLVVTAGLLVLFFGSSSKEPEQTITLPDAPPAQTPETPGTTAPEENYFAEITRQNVQDVLKSLARPSSYHQTLTIETYAQNKTRIQQADIWRSGALIRADLTEESGVKSILSDGQTVYLWYEGDETPLALSLREGTTAEQLIGIPTADTLLTISPERIESAEFVTLQEDDALSCIYVIFTQNDCTQYFWIDLASGLLCRQSIQQASQPLYLMQQNRLEVLMDGDEALSSVFCLPDGTEPFA